MNVSQIKRDLLKSRGSSSMFDQIASKDIELTLDDEEEEDHSWIPSDTLKATIKSLSFFTDLNPEEVNKDELINSYNNFDSWLRSEIFRIVSLEKAKEDKAAFGDLENTK